MVVMSQLLSQIGGSVMSFSECTPVTDKGEIKLTPLNVVLSEVEGRFAVLRESIVEINAVRSQRNIDNEILHFSFTSFFVRGGGRMASMRIIYAFQLLALKRMARIAAALAALVLPHVRLMWARILYQKETYSLR